MKLNGYCGNSSLYLNLSEYWKVIEKNHTQQGGRMDLPCVFIMLYKYSYRLSDSCSFIDLFLVRNEEVKLLFP